MADNDSTPSRQVLEETPERSLTFLRGIGTSPAIRAIMLGAGYTDAEHRTGWRLVHESSGYEPAAEGQPVVSLDTDPVVRDAIVKLDAWDEPNFARYGGGLSRLFPEQHAFVFNKLEPAQGAGAVVSVKTFLDRVDVLEQGSEERKAHRKQDQAAWKMLVERGLSAEVRKELRRLIEIAEEGAAPNLPVVDQKNEKERASQEAALIKLHAWYKDWSTTARSLITRRDYLIRLGLSKRKTRKKGPEGGDK